MPYQLVINSNGANVCGENFVNGGATGKLDGFSIVLGHEIEETVTDPGAEDVLGGAGLGNQKFLGGWYDTIDADENGDKCAWVGTLLDGGGTPDVMPIPGAVGNITGNRGTTFPVQSLWSNHAAAGLGYCAGAGTDLPTG
jgi:serine protease